MDTVSTTSTMPTVLSRAECFPLLRSARVGRVVYTDGALPAITPVYYVLDDENVVLRTTPSSRLAQSADGAVVAFQVDCIDDVRAGGWSVIVTGLAEPLTGAALRRARHLPLLTWDGDERSHYLRIVSTVVTGRLVQPRIQA